MDLGLSGKACVVTGSTGGIGLETAKLLVHHGADPHRRDSNGVSPRDRAEALGMRRLAGWFASS